MVKQADLTELTTWLETDEAASREGRARRLSHLLEAVQLPEDGLCFQGENSLQAFEEARLAYIHGLYLATVLLSLTCIEYEIAGRLYAEGWEKAKHATLEELLSEAHAYNMISDWERETLQKLRSIRNSHTHFRPPGAASSMTRRVVAQNMTANEVFLKDAEQAIKVLGRFLARHLSFF